MFEVLEYALIKINYGNDLKLDAIIADDLVLKIR